MIANAGGAFVIFAGDGFVELLAESLADRETLADVAFEIIELFDEGIVREFLFVVGLGPLDQVARDAFHPFANGIDRLLGPVLFEGESGRGLSAMEENEAAKASCEEI